MAGIREIETQIPDWTLQAPKADIKTDGSDFQTLMQKISDDRKAGVPLKKLTDDAEANSTAQNVIKKLFGGSNPEDLASELLGLSEADRLEVMGILAQLMNALDSNDGSAQGLLNRLFFGMDSASGKNDRSDAALQNIFDAMALLKNDEKATSMSAMAQLVAMLAAYDSDPNIVTEDMLPTAENGFISIMDGGSMFTVSNDTLRSYLSALIAQMGAPAVPETPLDPDFGVPPEVIPPIDGTDPIIPPIDGDGTDPIIPPIDGDGTDPIIPPIDDGTDPIIPPIDDGTDPIIPPTDGGTDPIIPPADGGTDSGTPPAEKTENIPVATPVHNLASSKQTAEAAIAQLANAARVKRSSELSELDAGAVSGLRAAGAPTPEIVPIAKQAVAEVPVQNQILSSIAETLSALPPNTSREMTMTLNPENLGEISIRMVHEAGQVIVTIAAQSDATQKLLADRMPALLQNLQTINGEVKEVRVDAAENSQLAGFNLGTTAQNGRDSSPQQQNNNANGAFTRYANTTAEAVPLAVPKTPDFFKGTNKLWQRA